MTKKFDIKSFGTEPIAEVFLQNQTVYLFQLSTRDISSFESLEKTSSPYDNFKSFLPSIASYTIPTKPNYERQSLDFSFTENLTKDELEKVAEAYLTSKYIKNISVNETKFSLPRNDNEIDIAYLMRVLEEYVELYKKSYKDLIENTLKGSRNTIFDLVKKSSSNLNNTLGQYQKFKNLAEISSIQTPSNTDSLFNLQAEIAQKQKKDRENELKTIKLTAELTANSASCLKEISDAVPIFLESSENRRINENKTTKLQLWIAAGSLIVSAILSLAALWFTYKSYQQDKYSNISNEEWQSKMIRLQNENINKYRLIETEVIDLRKQFSIQQLAIEKAKPPKKSQSK